MIGNLGRILLCWIFYSISSIAAAADSTDIELYESQIKALYLFKFATYVEWPLSAFPQPDSPFTIGIIGSDNIATELRLLCATQQLVNRPINIKSITSGISTNDLSGLQVLFVNQENSENLAVLIASTQPKPVLIVTEVTGALNIGSVINFIPVDEHIRFEISLSNAERNHLKIGSRLLSVAQKVEMRSIQ